MKSVRAIPSGKPTTTAAVTVAALNESPPAATKTIALHLNITPGGAGGTLTVNGKNVDLSNPVIPVHPDEPLELVVERPGFRVFNREFVLDSRQLGTLTEWLMDVPLEPVRFGYVTIRTTPSAEATIMMDGKPWVKKTPIENEKLPVGFYTIKLSNDVLGMEKTVNISVQEGKAVTVDTRLEIGN